MTVSPRIRCGTNEPDQPADRLGELCGLLDEIRAEVALLEAMGLHDAARRMGAYEKIVRRLVYSAISEVCAPEPLDHPVFSNEDKGLEGGPASTGIVAGWLSQKRSCV